MYVCKRTTYKAKCGLAVMSAGKHETHDKSMSRRSLACNPRHPGHERGKKGKKETAVLPTS